MVCSLITDTNIKYKGKAIPNHATKVCVLVGGDKGIVAFILLVLNGGYRMDEWGKGVRYLAGARGVSLVPGCVTNTPSYARLCNKAENRDDQAPPSSAKV